MSINEHIERMKDDIINSTVELVKIKSLEGEASEGKPFGEGPYIALEKALEISEKLGFKTKNLDGYVEIRFDKYNDIEFIPFSFS